jgi:ubiquitin-protein ligase
MSATPNQLDEIFRQVSEYFVSHPVISVSSTKGDPPDHYEITYTITGMCKNGEGQIVESIDHTVELVIPFGFPHFPPSCKPKSTIFHPDFDPAAICLGDFWEQDRLLSDLIIHIGKMINGEIYSTTNAFNEDAAEWYQKNSGKFPFRNINWSIENNSKPSPKDRINQIDTLDDTDLTTEFDFLALDEEGDNEESIISTSPAGVDSPEAIDFELLSLLESQKKYYTLLKTGESNTQPSDALTALCQQARDKIRTVEKLHRDGRKSEDKGDAQIAFEIYQQIPTIVTDFPTIDSDIQRIKQTLALLADISPDIALDFSDPHDSVESIESDSPPEKPIKNGSPKDTRKAIKAKPPSPNELFLPRSSGKNKLPLFLFVGLLAIVMGYSGYLWFSMNAKLNNAEATYVQCSTSHANNQFDVAKTSCEKVLQLVGEVKFIQQDRARQLEKSAFAILQSEKLSQGLAGNLFLDDRYIPKDEVNTILSINTKLKEAETLFMQEMWKPALELYKTLLAQAENSAYLDRLIIENIKYKRLMSEFRIFYDPAQISIQKKQWEDAIEKLLQAQKILVSLPESDRGQYSEKLQKALQNCQFANLKEQGDLSFTGSDWISAMESYNLALASSQETALPPESIDAIRNNIKRAELYTTINIGNKAFASGSWDDAIEAYSKASDLMTSSQGIQNETDSDSNIRKLDRIILQASIIRDRQAIQAMLENDDFMNARRTYLQIINAIKNSSFRTEEEFINTSAETSTAIKSLDEKMFQLTKVKYLKDNYQSLFTANFPAAIPENLTNPQVTNTKETESKLVFRMQCTEKGRGRPLTLVMFYAYDKRTGKWSFHSE